MFGRLQLEGLQRRQGAGRTAAGGVAYRDQGLIASIERFPGLRSGSLAEGLASIRPNNEFYNLLKKVLKKLNALSHKPNC